MMQALAIVPAVAGGIWSVLQPGLDPFSDEKDALRGSVGSWGFDQLWKTPGYLVRFFFGWENQKMINQVLQGFIVKHF